jgi:hypothetical protein
MYQSARYGDYPAYNQGGDVKADDENPTTTFERISDALEHINIEEICP